jgi:hypothetical protein
MMRLYDIDPIETMITAMNFNKHAKPNQIYIKYFNEIISKNEKKQFTFRRLTAKV